MATKKRMKRFDDGGMVGNSNYPFGQGQSQMQAPAQDAGGLGNTSPLVQVNTGEADAAQMNPATATPVQMKKGGAVKASRGDGIAQRGRTKGRFV